MIRRGTGGSDVVTQYTVKIKEIYHYPRKPSLKKIPVHLCGGNVAEFNTVQFYVHPWLSICL
jgi:hypothetical protein